MNINKDNRLNLYDYFGFPNRQQRDKARRVFDMEKLQLITITDLNLWLIDPLFEQYNVWSYHINNFRSHLGLHLLLMYYQYEQKPFDIIDVRSFQCSASAHKIFFDTFAEDVSLYLISYFDKHLEMFNDLFFLSKGKKKHHLSRNKIIDEMQKIDTLQKLAVEYRTIEQSQSFRKIKEIRDNFVHNKSSFYCGMNVERITEGGYSSFNSKGISTQEIYNAVCEVVHSYEQLCVATNNFFAKRIGKTT